MAHLLRTKSLWPKRSTLHKISMPLANESRDSDFAVESTLSGYLSLSATHLSLVFCFRHEPSWKQTKRVVQMKGSAPRFRRLPVVLLRGLFTHLFCTMLAMCDSVPDFVWPGWPVWRPVYSQVSAVSWRQVCSDISVACFSEFCCWFCWLWWWGWSRRRRFWSF